MTAPGSQVPEVVVFDLGKVLVDFDYGIAVEKVRPLCGVECDLRHLLEKSPLLCDFESGRVSSEEFYFGVKKAAKFSGTFAEFGPMFAEIFRPIPPMIEWQAVLRSHSIPTYIFSNTNPLAEAHIRASFPFFRNFDGYILSFEHGAMKPRPLIYEVVERMTGRRGPSILYIDDRVENVQAGKERGWRTILQVEPSRTVEQARSMGLPSDRL